MTANLLANVGSKSTLTISPSKEHICAINPSNINVNYYIALHYCKLIPLNQFDLTRESLMLVTLSLNFKHVYFLINLSKMSILTAILSLKLLHIASSFRATTSHIQTTAVETKATNHQSSHSHCFLIFLASRFAIQKTPKHCSIYSTFVCLRCRRDSDLVACHQNLKDSLVGEFTKMAVKRSV